MALAFSEFLDDTKPLSQQYNEYGDMIYVRHFRVPTGGTPAIPAKGANFPFRADEGITVSALLGPYIHRIAIDRDMRDGKYIVTVTGKLLAVRGSASSTSAELQGRNVTKTSGFYVFHTRHVATAAAYCPKVGDSLTSPVPANSANVAAKCIDVRVDDTTEPGRVIAWATWKRAIVFDESYA